MRAGASKVLENIPFFSEVGTVSMAIMFMLFIFSVYFFHSVIEISFSSAFT